MNLFELEDHEQREFYAVDLRHYRELFVEGRQKVKHPAYNMVSDANPRVQRSIPS
jgi:hypothetical protein